MISSPWTFDPTCNTKLWILPFYLYLYPAPSTLTLLQLYSSVCLIYDLTLLTHWVSGNRTWLFPTYPGLDLKFFHLAACLAFWPCSKRVPNLWFDPQEWPSERSHQRCVTPKPTCVSSYKCTLISIDITIGHFIRKISGCFNFVLGITALRNHPSNYI